MMYFNLFLPLGGKGRDAFGFVYWHAGGEPDRGRHLGARFGLHHRRPVRPRQERRSLLVRDTRPATAFHSRYRFSSARQRIFE